MVNLLYFDPYTTYRHTYTTILIRYLVELVPRHLDEVAIVVLVSYYVASVSGMRVDIGHDLSLT